MPSLWRSQHGRSHCAACFIFRRMQSRFQRTCHILAARTTPSNMNLRRCTFGTQAIALQESRSSVTARPAAAPVPTVVLCLQQGTLSRATLCGTYAQVAIWQQSSNHKPRLVCCAGNASGGVLLLWWPSQPSAPRLPNMLDVWRHGLVGSIILS